MESKKKVLVTGAAGRIGKSFVAHSHSKYDLKLLDRYVDESLKAYGEVVQAELADLERLKELFKGVHTVYHLAADPSGSAVWKSLLDNNIIGTYNVFTAAKAAGCKRVIYASSIHAIAGSTSDMQARTSDPVNPGDMYGVSKCFGEAMGRYMAEQENLSVIAIRIGSFKSEEEAKLEKSLFMMDSFVSHRDLNHLAECCIDVENLQWAILHGISNNTFKRLDISDTCRLVGYKPQDNLTDYNPLVKDLKLQSKIMGHNLRDTTQKSGLRDDL